MIQRTIPGPSAQAGAIDNARRVSGALLDATTSPECAVLSRPWRGVADCESIQKKEPGALTALIPHGTTVI